MSEPLSSQSEQSSPRASPADALTSPRCSRMATAALAFGVVALLVEAFVHLGQTFFPVRILGLPVFQLLFGGFAIAQVGLLLGVIAAVRSRFDAVRFPGQRQAIIGIVTSAAALLIPAVRIQWIMIRPHPEMSNVMKLARARANLNLIASSLSMYAKMNAAGAFPADLHALVTEQLLTSEKLAETSLGHAPAACDYYYVTGLKKDDPVDWIVAYCDAASGGEKGPGILYVDGMVRWLEERPFTREIQRFMQEFERCRGTPPTILPPG